MKPGEGVRPFRRLQLSRSLPLSRSPAKLSSFFSGLQSASEGARQNYLKTEIHPKMPTSEGDESILREVYDPSIVGNGRANSHESLIGQSAPQSRQSLPGEIRNRLCQGGGIIQRFGPFETYSDVCGVLAEQVVNVEQDFNVIA